MEQSVLLDVKGLKTHFFLDEGTVKAVEDVSFRVKHGTVLGIVGESGCGKSVTALSILKLVEKPGRIVGGQMTFCAPGEAPVDIAALGEYGRPIRQLRGNRIAMIFQEPMNSLSPVHTIGSQIVEVIREHQAVSKREARAQAIDRLRTVGIPRSEELIDAYTFQLSGGMRQRAMIAMALACNPNLLIADEPTTALDVTTQAQILELMKALRQQFGSSVILITHDLGVVAEMCDEVAVMYLGEVVEEADVVTLFHDPLHPYTRALIRSIPRLGYGRRQALHLIEGSVPNPFQRPTGCPFHPRCEQAMPGRCDVDRPQTTTLPDGRNVRCLLYENGSSHPEPMETNL